jgi:hypothetical protein
MVRSITDMSTIGNATISRDDQTSARHARTSARVGGLPGRPPNMPERPRPKARRAVHLNGSDVGGVEVAAPLIEPTMFVDGVRECLETFPTDLLG